MPKYVRSGVFTGKQESLVLNQAIKEREKPGSASGVTERRFY